LSELLPELADVDVEPDELDHRDPERN
jgi:hypothetical protein